MHSYFFNISDGMFDMCNHILEGQSLINQMLIGKLKVETFLYLINTLGAEMFWVGDFWLETRVIIKSSTHP